MSKPGALILICRSAELDDFNWFKSILHRDLALTYRDRITVIDVATSRELHDALLECPARYDIAEIHVFAECHADSLVVSEAAGEAIQASALGERPERGSLSIASYLPNTTCKIWFWSDSDQPCMSLLNRFANYFDHRFFFLPVAQLKRLASEKKAKIAARRASRGEASKSKKRAGQDSPMVANSSFRNFIVWFAILAGASWFFSDVEMSYLGDYEQTVYHKDTPYDVEIMTRGLLNTDGEFADHSWVYDRMRWDYTWFVAEAWLDAADRELAEAARISSGRSATYWGSVYNHLLEENQYRLGTIAKSLKREADRRNYDRYELASLTLAFVQYIPYKIPRNNLEVMTPPTTVSRRYGDCDTKSLLYVAIMQQLGFDVSLYISDKYRHAMAGVNVNAMGTYLMHQGRRYYFVETTAVGHRIGQLATGDGRTNSWRIIPVTNTASRRLST